MRCRGPRRASSEVVRRPPQRAFIARSTVMRRPRCATSRIWPRALGLAQVWCKDESSRLGLPSFKILGASWAVRVALVERLELEPSEIRSSGRPPGPSGGQPPALRAGRRDRRQPRPCRGEGGPPAWPGGADLRSRGHGGRPAPGHRRRGRRGHRRRRWLRRCRGVVGRGSRNGETWSSRIRRGPATRRFREPSSTVTRRSSRRSTTR